MSDFFKNLGSWEKYSDYYLIIIWFFLNIENSQYLYLLFPIIYFDHG